MSNKASILSLCGELIQAYSYPNACLSLCTEALKSWNTEQIAVCPWGWPQMRKPGCCIDLEKRQKSKAAPWQLQLHYLMSHQSCINHQPCMLIIYTTVCVSMWVNLKLWYCHRCETAGGFIDLSVGRTWVGNFKSFFQANVSKIFWLLPLKCEDLMLFFVISTDRSNIFGFLSDETRNWNIFQLFFRHFIGQNKYSLI